MSDLTELEARLLSAAELEDVNATRPPAMEHASDEQLKVLAQRLRRARDRARDIAAGQKREMRGKADPRGTKPLETTRVRSQRPKYWERPLSASRRN
jgi:hypothetical protein